jgi:beta-alanine--pyruvate transaminase
MGHAELTIQEQAVSKRLSLDEYWMPFTPNRDFKSDPQMVVRAEGMYLWNDRGDKIIDASSGLFLRIAGHGRKEIADAVGAQLRELDFCAPFLRAHPKQFELATRVAELTPGDLNRIFFVNSGSEAVDSAMKIALAYHQARGQSGRNIFVSRERAYHGVGLRRRRAVGPRQQPPQVRHRTAGRGAHAAHASQGKLLHQGRRRARRRARRGPGPLREPLRRENIAACFVEPIAGSSGCLVPPKGYLKRLREICDAHGILLVFDEVICGFGRTGQNFAAQSFGVTPDLLTMAKGLTNGSQPMGAVAVSERIHDTIMGAAPEGAIELFHGYTYSGHPASCAAALRRSTSTRTRAVRERPAAVAVLPRRDLLAARRAGRVDIRGYGMFATIDVHPGRRARQARPRVPEEALRQRPQPQDDRRLRDHRAAAHRGEEARRRDRGRAAPDAEGALNGSKRGALLGARRFGILSASLRGRSHETHRHGLLLAAFAAGAGMGAEGSHDRLPGHGGAVPDRAGSEGNREGHRLQGQLEAVRRRRRSHQGDGVRRRADRRGRAPPGLPPRCRAASRYELFWILDDIGSAEALVAKNGSGINSIADLKGKKIAMPFNSTTHFHTMVALEQAKINPADVQISTCGRPKCAPRGSAVTSRRRSSGIRCSRK